MKMFVNERRNKIMKLLQKKQRLTVKELARQIGVSDATLRTDLNQMEKEGLLIRTHGGAMLKDEIDCETSFSARKQKNKQEKVKIAKEALNYIEEEQCILLDASSTALEIAYQLKKQPMNLTIVTSGLNTALELTEIPSINVILIGGIVTNGSTSIEGTLGVNILEHVNIDIMFTSANGFSFETGLTDFNLYEVALKKEMVKRARKVIALVDSSKIGKNSSAFFATSEEIDMLITDAPVSGEMSNLFNLSDIDLVIS